MLKGVGAVKSIPQITGILVGTKAEVLIGHGIGVPELGLILEAKTVSIFFKSAFSL